MQVAPAAETAPAARTAARRRQSSEWRHRTGTEYRGRDDRLTRQRGDSYPRTGSSLRDAILSTDQAVSRVVAGVPRRREAVSWFTTNRVRSGTRQLSRREVQSTCDCDDTRSQEPPLREAATFLRCVAGLRCRAR